MTTSLARTLAGSLDYPLSTRVGLVIGSFVAYSLAIVPLYLGFGGGVGILAVIPVALAGWLLGVRGALLFGLMVIPLHTLILNLLDQTGWDVIAHKKGEVMHVIVLTVGLVVAMVRNPHLRLRRQFTERLRIEGELQRAHDELEIRVNERTAELRRSEEQFRTIFESSAVGMAIGNAKGELLESNGALQEMLGYTGDELEGMAFGTFTHPDDLTENLQLFGEMVGAKRDHYQLEKRYVTKDGTVRWGDLDASALRRTAGDFRWVAMVEDITERKRLESELLQSQKMESIGRLAGGVAHDFNNLLTPILAYAELETSALPAGESRLRTSLHEIKRAAKRAADLTHQLLAFSRRQVLKTRVTDLNELILGLDKLLRRVVGEDIELVTLAARGLSVVKVDPGQIEQVLINLVVNARDAMPRGGKLFIETSNVTLDEGRKLDEFETIVGEYAMLAVADTGIGMREEVKTRIFEPFFTTKEVAKGTGLGLSTCHGIVKQMGGHITIDSEPGQGTTFKVYLPSTGEATDLPSSSDESGYLAQGRETVLLVEDEPSVRTAISRALREQG